jgi:hypothetical protein
MSKKTICESINFSKEDIVLLFDSNNKNFITLNINDEKFFIKKHKSQQRFEREAFINVLFQKADKVNKIIPELICIRHPLLIFGYVPHFPFDFSNDNHIESFTSAILVFQDLIREIGQINKLKLILSTSPLQVSAIRLSLLILKKNNIRLFYKTNYILLKLLSTTKKGKPVLLHKDLRRNNNYRFSNNSFDFKFVDLESTTIESKFSMYDLIVFSFDTQNTTLDTKIIRSYLKKQGRDLNVNVFSQIRFSLIRFNLGLIKFKGHIPDFLSTTLTDDNLFRKWLNKQFNLL